MKRSEATCSQCGLPSTDLAERLRRLEAMLGEGVASDLSLRGHEGELRGLRSRLVEVEGRVAEWEDLWERFIGEVKGALTRGR